MACEPTEGATSFRAARAGARWEEEEEEEAQAGVAWAGLMLVLGMVPVPVLVRAPVGGLVTSPVDRERLGLSRGGE